MSKVVKFGGSSLASAEQFKKVGNIIRADKERKYVVPSAPGKRFSDDTKVTDMLYACYDLADQGKSFKAELDAIKARYQEIIDGLQLDLDLVDEFKTIEKNFKAKAGSNYAASRGEYLNGIIMANYLGYDFIGQNGIFTSGASSYGIIPRSPCVSPTGAAAAKRSGILFTRICVITDPLECPVTYTLDSSIGYFFMTSSSTNSKKATSSTSFCNPHSAGPFLHIGNGVQLLCVIPGYAVGNTAKKSFSSATSYHWVF